MQTQLTRLERLDLSHNLISRIENSEHLYRLSYLNLGHNLLTSVANVNLVLGNVTALVLRENQLVSLLGLEKLFNLRRLDLTANRLVDLGEVRELGTLPVLEQLSLARNPLAAAPHYRAAVLAAFAHDIVLDGRSPTPLERRQRADEQQLRAASSPVMRHATMPSFGAGSSTRRLRARVRLTAHSQRRVPARCRPAAL